MTSHSERAAQSSVARTRRHRATRRHGTRCILVDVNDGDVAALVARSHLRETDGDPPQSLQLIASLVTRTRRHSATRFA